ncbi:hypothetical protein MRB53_015826 [Persea americana]|uniref:Uncharacterized protein n=1 Tax=Persea americana TaxID=3435 RepID=A0ACC2M073_PERAE|nr:hypothetical protein MRB53_015826 [Persea americana]
MEWSLNAQNKIRGRKRWGFISGTKAAPKDVNSEDYEAWEDDNCLVKSWLLDAMTKEIRSLFLRLTTAKEIWEAVKQTYSELDDIDDCVMECTGDISKYSTKVNCQRVYTFLAGLDSQLDGVQGRVLATKPFPNIQTAYAMVCGEANCQVVMLGEKIGDGAAMISRKSSTSKKDRKCTHCGGSGHIADTCFRLHGYPDWHPKGKKTSQTSSTAKEEDTNSRGNLVAASGFTTKSGYKCFDPSSRRFYVSMDVIFHENELFYQPQNADLSLQGEHKKEVINHEELHAFFPISRASEDDETIVMDQLQATGSETITSQLDGEDRTTLEEHDLNSSSLHDSTILPQGSTQPLSLPQSSSPETTLKVPIHSHSTVLDDANLEPQADLEPQLSQSRFPVRSNRGIPPTMYEPDPKSKARYPISNHVSSKKIVQVICFLCAAVIVCLYS